MPEPNAILSRVAVLPGVGINKIAGPPQSLDKTERFNKTGLNLTDKILRFPDGTEIARTKDTTIILPREPVKDGNETYDGFLINDNNINTVVGRTIKGGLTIFKLDPDKFPTVDGR